MKIRARMQAITATLEFPQPGALRKSGFSLTSFRFESSLLSLFDVLNLPADSHDAAKVVHVDLPNM